MEYKTHTTGLFTYTAGARVGVLITEGVMKKLAKLQAKHLEDVKSLLSNEAENGNVFPSMWTLYHPDGVQTTVNYIDTSSDVYRQIDWATTDSQPIYHKVVYVAGSMAEAKDMALSRYEATGEAQ